MLSIEDPTLYDLYTYREEVQKAIVTKNKLLDSLCETLQVTGESDELRVVSDNLELLLRKISTE